MSLYDQIGPDALRAVLQEFYDRVFADAMIGFFFLPHDKARLVEKEFELTARLLGADVAYTGKPLRAAHAPHRIMKGQFLRRNRLLEQTLSDHQIAAEVVAAVMDHAARMERVITGRESERPHCVEPGPAKDGGVTVVGS